MQGRIKDIYRGMAGGTVVTIETSASPAEIEKLKDKPIEIKAMRRHRTLDANALLWACIGDIAKAIMADKWDVYLTMLRRYGQYTYVCVKPDAVEMVKRQWRETEVIGDYLVNGQKAVQMLCYYGSSTYDTKAFSALLDGVISEMVEMGLTPPDRGEMKRTLEEWEKKNGGREPGAKDC